MIVRAPRPEGNFYILNKAISEDPRLSWGARGLLVYLLGKPDHWQVSRQALINETARCAKPAGREAVAALLAELIRTGYCTQAQARLADGTLGRVEYRIHETRIHETRVDEAPEPARQASAAAPPTALPTAAPHTGLPPTAQRPQASIEGQARTQNKDEEAGAATAKLGFDRQAGTFTGLGEWLRAKWRASYPQVDLDVEIERAGAWLLANPAQDKKNHQRFLNNWLARAQDRAAGRVAAASTSVASTIPPVRPLSRVERAQAAGAALMGIPPEAYLPGATWPPRRPNCPAGEGLVVDVEAVATQPAYSASSASSDSSSFPPFFKGPL